MTNHRSIDMRFDIPSVRSYHKVIQFIATQLQLKPTDKVLEVGCGFGRIINVIAPQIEEAAGCDLYDMSKFIVNFKQCPANALPYPDNYFDKVFNNGVVQYFPNYEYAQEALQEMKRVCKPGGLVFIGDIDGSELTLPQKIWRKIRPKKSKRLLYKKDFFGGTVTEQSVWNYGFTRLSRFNVLIHNNKPSEPSTISSNNQGDQV